MADKKQEGRPAAQEQEGGGGEPERMDAPNQQAVGQPHPSQEGTGGEEGDLSKAVFAFDDDEPQQQPEQTEEPPKNRGGRPRKNT